jgi:hypothetical protein
MMSKSFVITNRQKLDRFLKFGGAINDIVLRVGILSGKPKYPRGHRGSRSDRPRQERGRRINELELQRRAVVRAGKRHLEAIDDPAARKTELKRIRGLFREMKISSRGLARKKTGAVAVARVAGVINAFEGYHQKGIRGVVIALERNVGPLVEGVYGRANLVRAIRSIGRNAKVAVRHAFVATGHRDTGRLVRNIQYELVSQSEKKRKMAEAKAERARIRAERKRRRGAR